MKWERANIALRLIGLILGVCGIAFAWHLTKLGASGAEDIPPPFTLASGLGGIACVCFAAIGRYPKPIA